MIREIFLVRHAESMGNLTGDYSTNQHDILSPNGQIQAQKLAECLENQHFHRIYVSPLGRAKQTLIPFLERTSQKAEIIPDLSECCWQNQAELICSQPEIPFIDFPLNKDEIPFFFPTNPSAPSSFENWADGRARMNRVKNLIESSALDQTRILILAHGYVLSMLLHFFTMPQIPVPGAEKIFFSHNTHLSKLSRHRIDTPYFISYTNRAPTNQL